MSNNRILPSPYRRGAEDGLWFGIYLTALFFASTMVLTFNLMPLVTFGLMIGVPFIIFFFLRRAYIADCGCSSVSAMWMHGIMIFICGGLIVSAVATIWLKWINPSYIIDTLHAAVEFYDKQPSPQAAQAADIIREAIHVGAVPSAILIVMTNLMGCIFSGSILSALLALLVKARPLPTNKPS